MIATASLAPTASDRPSLASLFATAFLTSVPDHVYFKDRDSRFLAVSNSLLGYFGCESAAEVVGKSDYDFFAAELARQAREDEEAILATGSPILGRISHLTWRDGRVTWMLTNKMPLRDETGAIVGTFGVSKDVTAAKQTELALEKANKELVDASRLAGMAEVATGVLHNVGNVLNSLNVSNSVVAAGIRGFRIEGLGRLGELLHEHRGNLAEFLTEDPKGRLVPEFIGLLVQHLTAERDRLAEEVSAQQRHIEHIKEIVALQQANAKIIGATEPMDAAAMIEDALRMNLNALTRHRIEVVRDFAPLPAILAERGKVLQILVNLIRNAKQAMAENRSGPKTLIVRLERGGPAIARLVVQDSGAGISPENLTRIFAHGFTTRAGGHGFGLHSSAQAAREMHGTLTVASGGPGTGASFALELPLALPASSLTP